MNSSVAIGVAWASACVGSAAISGAANGVARSARRCMTSLLVDHHERCGFAGSLARKGRRASHRAGGSRDRAARPRYRGAMKANTTGEIPWRAEAAATLALAWPLALTNLSQHALALTDTIILGWLSTEALAAGTLAANLYWAVMAAPL